MKQLIIFLLIALQSITAFAASQLSFTSDGYPSNLVLGGDTIFAQSSSAGFYLEYDNGIVDSTVRLPKLTQSGTSFTVSNEAKTISFDFRIDSHENHVTMHLLDVSGITTDIDKYSLRFRVYSKNTREVATYTLNDLVADNMSRTTPKYIELTWNYLWGRPRGDGSMGSAVIFNNKLTGLARDSVLAEIWSDEAANGHMVKPAVSSWTKSDVLTWVDNWVDKFKNLSEFSIGPDGDPDMLYEITNNYVIPLGVTRVYLFSSVWSKQRTTGYITSVNTKVFPNGAEDILKYQNYLAEHGISLHLHSMVPQLVDEDYISSNYVDDRLKSWCSGTLKSNISKSSTTIYIKATPKLGNTIDDFYEKNYFAIGGTEIIYTDSILNTDSDVWTLKGCLRGQRGTSATSHSSDETVKGLAEKWGNFTYIEDFDTPNSLGEKICGEYGEFLNSVKASHIHFDGTGRWQKPAWDLRELTDYVYSKLDHPTTGSTVGQGLLDAHFEKKFSKAIAIKGMLGYWNVSIRPRLHKTGRRHIETAPSKLELNFDVSDGIMLGSRRVVLYGGFSGFQITQDIIDNYGLMDYAFTLFKYWKELAPVFDDKDVDYMAQYIKKPSGSNHYEGADILILSKNKDNKYIFTPHHVMGGISGSDANFYIDQEYGAVARWQTVTSDTTIELINPNTTQQPKVTVFVENSSPSLVNPTFSIANSGSLAVTGTLHELEYMKFEGGDSVNVYDSNWVYKKSLPATATNFVVDSAATSITIGADASSNSANFKVQFVTLGDPYILETNKHIIDTTDTTTKVLKIDNPQNSVIFFPNPAIDTLNYKIKSNTTKNIYIYSNLGILVLTKKVTDDVGTIDISSLDNGVYHVKTDDGEIFEFYKKGRGKLIK